MPKPRILVIDDEESPRESLRFILKDRNEVILKASGKEGLAALKDEGPMDAVLLDMKMPEMTGLELIRMMAEKGCHASPQDKIIISSSLTPEQIVELRTIGCHYFPKPFHLEELLKLIHAREKHIPPDRKLVPVEELWKTVRT